ncbi:hypothetical protein QTP88_008600 [Uroleucon formosanum]
MDDARRDELPNARECRDQQLRDFISKSGAGADDIYQPSSWLFEELSFLADLEKPVDSISSINDDTNNDKLTVADLTPGQPGHVRPGPGRRGPFGQNNRDNTRFKK